MVNWQTSTRTLLLGLIVGLVFGSVNVLFTWRDPLADDTPAALLRFYGPMFFIWALASFRAARRTGRLEGRFVIDVRHRGLPWEVIVEPDEIRQLLMVITAYPVEQAEP